VSGGGGGYYFMQGKEKLNRGGITKEVVVKKPLFFAELSDIIVSVPSDSGSSDQDYIQLTVQFSTVDQNAVTDFGEIQPIIKAKIISLLMAKTVKSIMDPKNQNSLSDQMLAITNDTVIKSVNYNLGDPFMGAYITNLVEQN
jgi:flagellar basal body-associated protein FliL